MARSSLAWLVIWITTPASLALARDAFDFFERRIRPVLAEHCYGCHSASAATNGKLRGRLQLDTRAGIRAGGESGPAVVPGRPKESRILDALRHVGDLRMPPEGKLPESTVRDFTAWIERGAADPRDGDVVRPPSGPDLEAARESHWAYRALRHPALPKVADPSWCDTPVDRFILRRLERERIQPAETADPATLLRRVFTDLVGLPPPLETQREFLADPSPTRYERIVDELLASPRYGERWGRHWLDVARYAETKGYERDEVNQSSWRYRDYVIEAFNDDKPYDRFLLEQLAGDELPDADAASQTATSFLRVGPLDTIAPDGKLARYDHLDDVLSTTTTAFLGMTLQCARCHDHKFEPLSQRDYYGLLAVFDPLDERRRAVPVGNADERRAHDARLDAWKARYATVAGELDALRGRVVDRVKRAATENKPLPKGDLDRLATILAKAALDRSDKDRRFVSDRFAKLRSSLEESESEEHARLSAEAAELRDARPADLVALAAGERGKKPKPTHLFVRGDVHRPGDPVAPAVPSVLGDSLGGEPVPTNSTSGRRLWLARWMLRDARALVARVMAHRVWFHHFGVGLLEDPGDFGIRGGTPSHPELLEWLASEFVRRDWSVKALHREIVLSRTYRLASRGASPGVMSSPPPDSRLFSSWTKHRLQAEVIRDSLLAVSGQLNRAMAGPSVYPKFGRQVVGASSRADWRNSTPAEAARRSVYVFAKRALPLPELAAFDQPDASVSSHRRAVSTTSVQALMLWNGEFAQAQATALAARLARDVGDDSDARIERAFRLVLARAPTPRERRAVRAFVDAPRDESTPADRDVWASFCLVLINSSEFVYQN